MSTTDERILRTLRAQAWERAKGELQSVLQTYWDGHGGDGKFKDMDAAVKAFVAKVEGAGLTE